MFDGAAAADAIAHDAPAPDASADTGAAADAHASNAPSAPESPAAATDVPAADQPAPDAATEVAFVDTRLDGWETLVGTLRPGIEVVQIDASRDGIVQIAEHLANRSGIETVHIFSHGAPGAITLGATELTAKGAEERSAELADIGRSLTCNADILVYGCDVAASADGQNLVNLLAQHTGADVAASSDATGSPDAGGNWVLEAQTGSIEALVAVEAQSEWSGILDIATSRYSNSWYSYSGYIDGSDAENTARPGSKWDRYSINVSVGATVELYMKAGSLLDPWIQVTDASGNIIVQNDDAGNGNIEGTYNGINSAGNHYDSYVSFTYQAGYIIRATTFRAYSNGGSGSYTLYMSSSGGAVNVQPLPPVNYAPSGLSLSNASASENSGAGTTVGTLSTTDTSGDSHTYSIVGGASDRFQISGNQLQVRSGANLNYEAATSHSVTIRTTDTGGLTCDRTFTIAVNNVAEAPTSTALSASTVQENAAGGVVIGTISSTDQDAGSSFSYAIIGGVDASKFQIVGNQLRVANNAVLNYEAQTTAQVQIRTTDQSGLYRTDTFTITLTNANEAPVMANVVKAAFEDVTLSFTVANFTAAFSDPDAGSALSAITVKTLPAHGQLLLNGNPVAANATVALASLANLTYVPAANYNGADSFTVTASDGSLVSNVATVTLNVAPVNDRPSFATGTSYDTTLETAEDSGAVVIANFIDPASLFQGGEAGGDELDQMLSFQATNDNAALFSSQPTVTKFGTLSYTPAANACGTATVTLILRDDGGTANGGQNQSAPLTFTITINPVNDAPVVNASASPVLAALAEDVADGSNAGTLVSALVPNGSITDADGSAVEAIALTGVDASHGSWEYRIGGGAWTAIDAGTLSVSNALLLGANDAMRFKPTQDYNGNAFITYKAWDGTAGAAGSRADASAGGGTSAFSAAADTASITVTAVDDAPTLTISAGAAAYDYNAATRGPVAVDPNLTITDVDAGTAHDLVSMVSVNIENKQTGDVLAWDTALATASGISGSFSAATGVLTFTGTATAAQYQALLRTVTFGNTTNPADPSQLDKSTRVINFTMGNKLAYSGTQHFYEFVSAPGITWDAARDAAATHSFFGLQGYLATVTSAGENAFIAAKLQGEGWMGAADAAVEGTWRWVTGPEAGTLFFTQTSSQLGGSYGGATPGGGLAIDGMYSNWAAGEPNDWGDNEDNAHFLANGAWNDYAYNNGSIRGYVVEYGGMPGDAALTTVSVSRNVQIISSNNAPRLDTSPSPVLTSILEDAGSGAGNVGNLVSQIVAATSISDVDGDDQEGPIAVVAVDNSHGTWQYALNDGSGHFGAWTGIDGNAVSTANALLLMANDKLRFVPAADFAGTASFAFRAWDTTTVATHGQFADMTMFGGASHDPQSVAIDTATITVTAVNDAPNLNAMAGHLVADIHEDVADGANAGTTIADMVTDGAIVDMDGSATEAVAITGVDNSHGAWQYFHGGAWEAIGPVSAGSALLLDATDKVRFVPEANWNGIATITFKAWDKSAGAAYDRADTSGGAFSTISAHASATVAPVNDAPASFVVLKDGVSDGQAISSPKDAGVVVVEGVLPAIANIPVTGGADETGETRYYQTVGVVTNSGDLAFTTQPQVLPDGSLMFESTAGTRGAATVTVRLYDSGGTANGGANYVERSFVVTVTNANTNPTLDTTLNPALSSIAEDAAGNPGTSVAAIVPNGSVTDPNGAVEAIAVTGVDNSHGVWQFSIDNGTTWVDFSAMRGAAVADLGAQSVYLDGTNLMRFVPDSNWHGTANFTYRAWDKSNTLDDNNNLRVDGGGNPLFPAGSRATATWSDRYSCISRQSETASIVVASVNDAPVAVGNIAAAAEAGGVANGVAGLNPGGNVLGDDSDVDGDPLTVTRVFAVAADLLETEGGVGAVLAGSYGSLTLGSDGAYTYVVDNGNPAVQALRTAGNTLTDTFRYVVSDGIGTTSATLVVTITGANDDPVATADAAGAVEASGTGNATLGTDPAGNVLANDTDVDAGDSRTVTAVSHGATSGTVGTGLAGSHGVLTLNADGSYLYAVDQNNPAVEALRTTDDVITDQFSYVTTDLGGQAATSTLTITIRGGNDFARVVNDTGNATEARGVANVVAGSPATGNVLANDSDVDTGDSIALSDVAFGATPGSLGHPQAGQYGTLTLNADGSYAYVVNEGHPAVEALRSAAQTLTEDFQYTVRDNDGERYSATLRIVIHGSSDTPFVVNTVPDQSGSAVVGWTWRYQIPADTFGDIDAGEAFTYAAATIGGPLPGWLTFDAATRTLSGQPPAGENVIEVRITATDLSGASVSTAFNANLVSIVPAQPSAPPPPPPPAPVATTPPPAPDMGMVTPITAPPAADVALGPSARDSIAAVAVDTGSAFAASDAARPSLAASEAAGSGPGIPLLSLTPPADGAFQVLVRPGSDSRDATLVTGKLIGEVTQTGAIAFTVPSESFIHNRTDVVVTLQATLADGRPLPGWLRFNPETGQFQGDAPDGVRAIEVKLMARDIEGREAVQVFKLNVQSDDRTARDGERQPGRRAFLGKPGLSEEIKAARSSRVASLAEAIKRHAMGKAA